MQELVEDVLSAWREGERLLEELPPIGTDHEIVRLAVAVLHVQYISLTAASGESFAALGASRERIEDAHAVIRQARARLDRTGS